LQQHEEEENEIKKETTVLETKKGEAGCTKSKRECKKMQC